MTLRPFTARVTARSGTLLAGHDRFDTTGREEDGAQRVVLDGLRDAFYQHLGPVVELVGLVFVPTRLVPAREIVSDRIDDGGTLQLFRNGERAFEIGAGGAPISEPGSDLSPQSQSVGKVLLRGCVTGFVDSLLDVA